MNSRCRAIWKFVILLVTVALLVGACGPTPTVPTAAPAEQATEIPKPTETPEPKVLVIAEKNQYSDTFDISRMAYTMPVHGMIYDTLLTLDTNYEIQPGGLAKGWDVSEDGKVVTFYLKEGVTFHDGSKFDAEVLKWYIELMAGDECPVSYEYKPITEVEIIDDYTVALHFDEPFPALFYYLSNAFSSIMSKEAYESLGPDEYATHPSGTGPFILESWVQNESLTLIKNPDYNWAPEWTGHKGPANVDKIIYRIIPEDATRLIELEAGNVDMIFEAPLRELARYEEDPNYQVLESPYAQIWFIGMNLNAPIVADLRTRQAIGHAIDRDLIAETIFQGHGEATGLYLAKQLEANEGVEVPLYDLTAAADLLAEAGWVMGDDGVLVAESVDSVDAGTRFEVDYWTYQEDEALRLAEVTQNMLLDVGIKLNIVPMEKATYDENLEAGGHSIILRRYVWDGLDILPWWFAGANRPYPNFIGTNDPEIDQLWADAEKAASWEERTDLYREGYELLIDRWYPWAPIFQPNNITLMRSRVKNYPLIPLRSGDQAEPWVMVDLEK
jgi:peptide/nickel transport system substrate-binding protein